MSFTRETVHSDSNSVLSEQQQQDAKFRAIAIEEFQKQKEELKAEIMAELLVKLKSELK